MEGEVSCQIIMQYLIFLSHLVKVILTNFTETNTMRTCLKIGVKKLCDVD